MEWLTGIHWGYWILFAAGVYFVGVPLLILPTFRIEANPTLQIVNPAELPLPGIVQQHLDAVETDLQQSGFAAVETVLLPCPLPNASAVLRVYVNRATQEAAMANSVFGMAGGHVNRHVQYVEFTTRYVDGHVFNTLNSSEPGSFPIPSHVLTVRIPWMTDVRRLHKIHQAITAAKGPAGPKQLRLDATFDGDVLAFIQACMREEMEHARSVGYLQLTASASHYRATLLGAYLMTWRQLPPIKQLLMRRDRRRVEALLREFGVPDGR